MSDEIEKITLAQWCYESPKAAADYIESLEKENDELKKKLAEWELSGDFLEEICMKVAKEVVAWEGRNEMYADKDQQRYIVTNVIAEWEGKR